METQVKKALFRILRLLLGALFVFSGITKCIDPTGGAIKIEDYFVAWGLDGIPWWVCMSLSVAQNVVEFATGFMLLCGAFVNVASGVALAFMVFYTPLTLYIALANPVSDCGCFGDAFTITNWQTFWKNIFFLAVAVAVFAWRKIDGRGGKWWRQLALTATGAAVAMLITIKGITDEPIIDFRPYAVGTNIRASMTIPDGAPVTEYKTTFVLEKDGVRQEFDEHNYPYDDSTWVYIDSRSEVIKEGYTPPIADFTFTMPDGEIVTDRLLDSPAPVFLAVSPKLEKADKGEMAKLGHQCEMARKNGFEFYVATSSANSALDEAMRQAGTHLDFLFADETMLKTMARSNPGLLILQSGVVVAKYNLNHTPFDTDMKSPAASYLSNLKRSYDWMTLVCLGMACVIVWQLLRGGKSKARRSTKRGTNR